MKKTILLLLIITLSVYSQSRTSKIISRQNMTISELKNQTEQLLVNSEKLSQDIDSLTMLNKSYKRLNEKLENDVNYLESEIEYKNKQIRVMQSDIKNLRYLWYIVGFLGLTLVSTVIYSALKLRDIPKSKSNKFKIETNSNSTRPRPYYNEYKQRFSNPEIALNNKNATAKLQANSNNELEKVIEKSISKSLKPIYELFDQTKSKIDNNEKQMELFLDQINIENRLDSNIESKKLGKKIENFSKTSPESGISNKESSQKQYSSKKSNQEEFLDSLLGDKSELEKIMHSSVGTFEHLNASENSTGISQSSENKSRFNKRYRSSRNSTNRVDQRIGSDPYSKSSPSRANQKSGTNTGNSIHTARAVIPNSIHSCLTEYNNILRQINVGMMTEYEIEKRINSFKSTFGVINVEYIGNGKSSVKEFSENRYGNFYKVEFGKKSFLLPSFNKTMDRLVHAFGFNGMESKVRPPAVMPRQVIKFANIYQSNANKWQLREKGQLL
ncbi:MAG: hypothetical protein ACLFSQ_01335 [Candidatus Zixiibacteriota bacterium]